MFFSIVEPEETIWIIGNFVICSIAVIVAISICFILSKRVINEDIINIKAAYFAIISAFCSIITYLSVIFLYNNEIIQWDYPSNSHSSLREAINITTFSCSKLSFYFGFTYHILYLYDNNNYKNMRLYLKIWMLLFAIIISFCCMSYITENELTNTTKATGYLQKSKIHITMYLSLEGATLLNKILLFVMMMFYGIYFGLLIYLYAKRLKIRNQNLQTNANIGLTLMTLASSIYIIFLIVMMIGSPLKWIFYPIDIMIDDICLFFLFSANKIHYEQFFEQEGNDNDTGAAYDYKKQKQKDDNKDANSEEKDNDDDIDDDNDDNEDSDARQKPNDSESSEESISLSS